jgi:hypothetical protein
MADEPELDSAVDPRKAAGCQPAGKQIDVGQHHGLWNAIPVERHINAPAFYAFVWIGPGAGDCR